MTWKQFRKIAIRLNILLISGAWAVSLISSIIEGSLHDFTGRLPILALFSILGAIFIPVLAFGVLHIAHYIIWWSRHGRETIQDARSGTWWFMGSWLIGFVLFVTINILGSITGLNYEGILYLFVLPMFFMTVIFGIIALVHICRFSFIKRG